MNLSLRILTLLLFISSFLLMSKALFLGYYPDFSNYYIGPIIAFTSGNPYLPNINLFTPTTYPPNIFIIFYPLHFIPVQASSFIWTLGSIICLLASIYIILKIYKQKITSNISLVLFSLAFLSFPVKFTLGMGQINLYILLLLSLFLYYFNKKKTVSGLFLGITLVLKLFPIFLIPYLFFIKKWKELAYILVVVLFASILTILFVDKQTIIFYLEKIFPTLLNSWKADYYNQSLSGFISRTNIDLAQKEILRTFISGLLIAATFLIVIKNKSTKLQDLNLKVGTILTLNLLVNNFSWQHHFVWLIIPFITTFFYLYSKKSNPKLYIFLLISYVLVAINFKNPLGLPLILQSHIFWGALILLFLQLYLIFKSRTTEG